MFLWLSTHQNILHVIGGICDRRVFFVSAVARASSCLPIYLSLEGGRHLLLLSTRLLSGTFQKSIEAIAIANPDYSDGNDCGPIHLLLCDKYVTSVIAGVLVGWCDWAFCFHGKI